MWQQLAVENEHKHRSISTEHKLNLLHDWLDIILQATAWTHLCPISKQTLSLGSDCRGWGTTPRNLTVATQLEQGLVQCGEHLWQICYEHVMTNSRPDRFQRPRTLIQRPISVDRASASAKFINSPSGGLALNGMDVDVTSASWKPQPDAAAREDNSPFSLLRYRPASEAPNWCSFAKYEIKLFYQWN